MNGEKKCAAKKIKFHYGHSKNDLVCYVKIVNKETTVTKMTVFANVVTPLSEMPIEACFYSIGRR